MMSISWWTPGCQHKHLALFPEHSNFVGLLLYCSILYLARRAATHWILTHLWYLVCACERVRQRLCNTMLFRNDSTSAPLLDTRFHCEPQVCFLPLLCYVAAVCSCSAGFSFTGSGWWRFLAVGVRGLDPSSDVRRCVWSLRWRELTASVKASVQTCTNSNSHKDANRRTHSLIISCPSCEKWLLIWSNTYCAQAAVLSFVLFSASEDLERTPGLA